MTSVRRLIIATRDTAGSQDFYAGVLGLTTSYSAPPVTALATADGVEILLHEQETTPSDRAVSLSFAVDDLDGLVETWRTRGGVVIDEPELQPWGERQAVVRDPDGHVVCLVARAG